MSNDPNVPPIARTRVIVLACNCHREYKPVHCPSLGEEVWCPVHNNYKKVIRAPHSYSVKCLNCRYSRGFGTARLTAEGAITRHRNKCPEHHVEYWDGHHLIWTFTPENSGQKKLDMDSSDPPY